MRSPPSILFTAFEPSGDALAAPLIARWRKLHPDQPVYALGGWRMAAAGATLLERTTERPAMLAAAAGKALEHRRYLRRLRVWMRDHDVQPVVPTDSPAGNWAVCQLTRRLHPRAKIVHLAAPQLWAWAPWRIRRLRRLSDHVLCLLPFEPEWFARRDMPATFVGHPLFNAAPAPADGTRARLPDTRGCRLALLPGSRLSEINANWPTMLDAYCRLEASQANLAGVAAVGQARLQGRLRSIAASSDQAWPESLQVVAEQTASVLEWADVVLLVSGTATLQVAAHHTPMVVLYNVNPLAWHGVGRWMISTRTFALPNLIGESLGMGKPVTELIPHFGAVTPVVDAVKRLMTDGPTGSAAERAGQLELFDVIARQYAGTDFAASSAAALDRVIG